jgi:hypothetical protein
MAKNKKAENKDSLPSNQEVTKKKGRAKGYSRTKGHNGEREYARRFKEDLGFGHCKTSRQASRLLDDCGVDLCMIPFNVQIKCGYWKVRPKADLIFRTMKEKLNKNFPEDDPVHNHPKVLIHKLDGHSDENQLVTMMWKDWVKLLKAFIEKEKESKNTITQQNKE